MPIRLTDDQEENVRQTYYGLRLAMVVLTIMLYLAIFLLYLTDRCWQPSISEYYFSPVRPVLIAALTAIGAGLIIHRGNDELENTLLDVAGFSAVVVAFVPTSPPDPGVGCNTGGKLLGEDLAATIDPALVDKIELAYTTRLEDGIATAAANSVLVLLLAGLTAVVLSRFLKPRFVSAGPILTRSRWRSVTASLVVGLTVFYLVDHSGFLAVAHGLAAFVFFILIISVIVMNGCRATEKTRRWRYWGTAIGTVLCIGGAFLRDGVHEILWVETFGIVGFTVFWLLQTQELGGFVDKDEMQTVQPSDPPDPQDGVGSVN